jgi:hypothetical protein
MGLPEGAIVKLHGKDLENIEITAESQVFEMQSTGDFILLKKEDS